MCALTLRQKQSKFAVMVASLISQAIAMGFDVTLGEAYRSPQEAARLAKLGKGIKNSLHTKRLAIDLHLFKNGKLLTRTDYYLPLGIWWEVQQGGSWGGRFNDGGHFSLEHNGIK